jgi:hypothetical protein
MVLLSTLPTARPFVFLLLCLMARSSHAFAPGTRKASTAPLFSSPSDRNEARKFVSQGMETFRKGDVPQSIELFDRADVIDSSMRPFLWQRGLSLYYADRFKDASDQFRADVAVNPYDVEEIVWDIAAQLQLKPNDFPVPSSMALPPGSKDRRKIMATVYNLFRGEGTEEDLALAGHAAQR